MPLTKDFKQTVQVRAANDPAFREALLKEGVECLLGGELDTGKASFRNYINATIGFAELAKQTNKSPKTLMHMFSPSGNPQAQNLFTIIDCLLENEGIHLEVKAVR